MNNQITETIEKFNMLSCGDTVLLAVSGGADSMLMLDYFVHNKDKLGVTVKVAHVEHGIRGQSSINDAEFVKQKCENYNIEFHMLSIDAVNGARQEGQSVEEYSRNKRYEFFDTILCDKIATAHNLTDNIETLLFRLARGTGLKGVCGIPPVRDKIIRPLIEISSSDIRKYCLENNIEYRTDETNSNNDYSRNKVRNEILPVLSSLNSEYEQKLADFISDINEDNAFIENASFNAYNNVVSGKGISLIKLRELDVSVQKRVIKRYFQEKSAVLDRFHLSKVTELVHKTGRVQIANTLFAVSNKDFLRCADFDTAQNDFAFVSQILNINEFNRKNVDFYCDCDKIIGNVIIRRRNEGDCISPAGRNCTKSLKKMFNELAIPVESRDNVGVVCDDSGVIGIIFDCIFCTDERVKTDKNTKRVLTIKFPMED